MKEYKRQNLSANERKIVELTLQGEIQEKIVDEILVIENTLKHNRELIKIKENQISRKINTLYS